MKMKQIILSLVITLWTGWVHASCEEIFINGKSVTKLGTSGIAESNHDFTLNNGMFNQCDLISRKNGQKIEIGFSNIPNTRPSLILGQFLVSGKDMVYDQVARSMIANPNTFMNCKPARMIMQSINMKIGIFKDRSFSLYASEKFITFDITKTIEMDGCLLHTSGGIVINSCHPRSLIKQFKITPHQFTYHPEPDKPVKSQTIFIYCDINFINDYYELSVRDATVEVHFNPERIQPVVIAFNKKIYQKALTIPKGFNFDTLNYIDALKTFASIKLEQD